MWEAIKAFFRSIFTGTTLPSEQINNICGDDDELRRNQGWFDGTGVYDEEY